MRLLNVDTLQLETFHRSDLPLTEYAVLSHTWGQDEGTLRTL